MYLSLGDRPHRTTTPAGTSTLADGPADPAGPAGPAAPPRGRRRPVGRVVVVLGLVSLLTDVSSESAAAILPLYLTTVAGVSVVAFGLIDGLYQGASALVRPLGGWLSDRTDRPKWVAFSGYALSALARVFLLLVGSAGGVGAVVATDRLGKGLRTAPRDAMISAATPPEHLGRAFGVHRTLDTIGAAAGPLLAAALLLLVPGGYDVVLVVSLGFAVLGVALLGLFGPDQRTRSAARAPARTGTATGQPERTAPPFTFRDLTDPRLRRLLLVSGGLGLLTVGDAFVYLTLFEYADLATAAWFPMLYVGTNVAYLALAVPLGGLADRVGRGRVLVFGHVALAGAYLVAGTGTGTVVAMLACLLLLGAFYAATDGVTAAVAGGLVPARARASGIAAAQTVVAVSRMVATAGFGLLWVLLGAGPALLATAAGLGVAVLLASTQIRWLDR